MKNLHDLFTKNASNYYNEKEKLNQSTLKLLQNGLEKYKELKEKVYKPSEAFNIGNAVDMLLTQKNKNFLDYFYIPEVDIVTPSNESVIKICNKIIEIDEQLLEEDKNKLVLSYINEENWQPRYKDETKITKFLSEYKNYIKILKDSKNKTILSLENFKTVINIVNSLLNNEKTKDFFIEKENTKIFYQVKIDFDISYIDNLKDNKEHIEIPAKGLIDMLILSETEDEIIVQLIDLKTTGDYTINFEESFYKYRYDIQSNFYNNGIATVLEKFIKENNINKKIKIKPFIFIVESTKKQGCPLVFQVSKKTHIKTFYNFEIKNKEYKGLKELLDEYVYYLKTDFKEDIRVKKIMKL